MQGITVPKAYRSELRADRDNAMRDADIKELIEARKGHVITSADFIEATGVTSAMLHVKRLMKSGHVVRTKVKRPGERQGYGYKWMDKALLPKQAALANGETYTTTLNLPPLPMTDQELEHLSAAFHDWIDDGEPDGPAIVAVRDFRDYMVNKCAEIKAERERIVKGKDQ